MKWDRNKRLLWTIGDSYSFKLSKNNCSKLLFALCCCDGAIHGTNTEDVNSGIPVSMMRTHKVRAVFLISLPVGAESLFRELTWHGILEVPPKASVESVPVVLSTEAKTITFSDELP